MEEVACFIQPLKVLKLAGDTKLGCGVIDITFPTAAGVHIEEISFQNNYTASITVKGKLPANIQDGKLMTVVQCYELMKKPHYADESQKHVKLKVSCPSDVYSGPFTGLRLIIRQPSPQWQKFGIENIKIYRRIANMKDGDVSCSETLEHSSQILQVTNHMKNLKELSAIMRSLHLENEPDQFEVDDSYDINLLSYT